MANSTESSHSIQTSEAAPIKRGAGDGRSKGRGDARGRLIEAARELFHQKGYEATSVAEILQKADVGSGSLYYFFDSKEDLLRGVLEWYRAHLWSEVIEPVFSQVSDPIERVFGVLGGYQRMLLETNLTFGCPIGNLALELSGCDARTRQGLTKNFDGWKAAIQGCLEAAKGRLGEVDAASLASFVLTVMEGAVMQARTYRRIEPFDEAVRQLRDYFARLERKEQQNLSAGR